jgi:hypothetical protein
MCVCMYVCVCLCVCVCVCVCVFVRVCISYVPGPALKRLQPKSNSMAFPLLRGGFVTSQSRRKA